MRITEQSWPEGTLPVVSVFNWTYNHAPFIRQSIESILEQETTFPVEIIIHDDASTDGTTEIIREYEKKHPQLFRNIIQTENQWSQGKSVMTPMFEAPRGEFVALTHGDDYWTHRHKLQKQYNCLIELRSSSGCFHIAQVTKGQHSKTTVNPPPHLQRDRVLEDISFCFWLPTCSLFYRKQKAPLDLNWAENVMMGDAPLIAELCERGSMVFLPEVWSGYREHDFGTWSRLSWMDQQHEMVKLFNAAEKRFGPTRLQKMRICKKNMCAELASRHAVMGDARRSVEFLWQYATTVPTRGVIPVGRRKDLFVAVVRMLWECVTARPQHSGKCSA